MERYFLSSVAEEDVFAIWKYIGNDNVTAADRMIDRLTAAFARVGRFPEAGAICEYPKGNLRFIVVSPYLVFYKIIGDEVAIVRVLHRARRWDELL